MGSNGKAPTWPGHQTPGPAQGKKVPISINPEERRVGWGVARLRRAFRPASPGHPRPGFPKDTLIHAVFPWGARLSPDAEPEVKDCSVSCPGVPQDAGPRKKGRASKKVPLRQKLNRKMLKKLLIKLWKLLVRRCWTMGGRSGDLESGCPDTALGTSGSALCLVSLKDPKKTTTLGLAPSPISLPFPPHLPLHLPTHLPGAHQQGRGCPTEWQLQGPLLAPD